MELWDGAEVVTFNPTAENIFTHIQKKGGGKKRKKKILKTDSSNLPWYCCVRTGVKVYMAKSWSDILSATFPVKCQPKTDDSSWVIIPETKSLEIMNSDHLKNDQKDYRPKAFPTNMYPRHTPHVNTNFLMYYTWKKNHTTII